MQVYTGVQETVKTVLPKLHEYCEQAQQRGCVAPVLCIFQKYSNE